jgi:hypothetical protein
MVLPWLWNWNKSLINSHSHIPKWHNGFERQSFLCGLMGVVQKRRIILDFFGQFGINNENLFKINNWFRQCRKGLEVQNGRI